MLQETVREKKKEETEKKEGKGRGASSNMILY